MEVMKRKNIRRRRRKGEGDEEEKEKVNKVNRRKR